KGPTWIFDLDYLTNSMNYHPVRSENQANHHACQQEANHNAGTEDIIDAGDSEKEDESSVQRDPLFDEIPEDTFNHMETENAQDVWRTREIVDEDKEIDENILSTDKEKVSTDKEKVSTDRPIVSTDES
ncbi:hypothetical protein Tco_0166052, partial [Tanacetum coccineum]